MNAPKRSSLKRHVTSKVCDVDLLKFSTVSNALQTSARVVVCLCLKKLTFAFSSTRFKLRYALWLNDTYYTAKVCERTNKNLPARDTMIQLLALYTDPKSHNAQRYKQTDVWTDRQTDDMMMPIADHSSMIGKNLDHSPRKKPTTPRCLSM